MPFSCFIVVYVKGGISQHLPKSGKEVKTMKVMDLALKFVDLTLKYQRSKWREVKELVPDEMELLKAVVAAAGFEPKAVAMGWLKGHYADTYETYQINSVCPVKVAGEAGDDPIATGWLDALLRNVLFLTARSGNRHWLARETAKEIRRSVPLRPIQLTPQGDYLLEYPPSRFGIGPQYLVDHTRDNNNLPTGCVGVHRHCNSWVDRVGATETHDALACRGCNLQVYLPREVQTYGGLRRACASSIKTSAQ